MQCLAAVKSMVSKHNILLAYERQLSLVPYKWEKGKCVCGEGEGGRLLARLCGCTVRHSI